MLLGRRTYARRISRSMNGFGVCAAGLLAAAVFVSTAAGDTSFAVGPNAAAEQRLLRKTF
jgi:hypothetical protein